MSDSPALASNPWNDWKASRNDQTITVADGKREDGQGVLPVDIVFILSLGVNDHPDLDDITVRHIVIGQCGRAGQPTPRSTRPITRCGILKWMRWPSTTR